MLQRRLRGGALLISRNVVGTNQAYDLDINTCESRVKMLAVERWILEEEVIRNLGYEKGFWV